MSRILQLLWTAVHVIIYFMSYSLSFLNQCCGSEIIYSGYGSGSSSEFSEFRIWIRFQAKVPDPCGSGSNTCYLSYLEIVNKTTLNSIIQKHLSTICHFLFHTTAVHKVQNLKKIKKIVLSALSY